MASERQLARGIVQQARHEARVLARRRVLHPCPTCRTSGHIRRSFGFAYHGDPRSEASVILSCPTCHGTGAQPKHGPIVALKRDERPAELHEVFEVRGG